MRRGVAVPCCEPYPGKTILFMSDWLYTAGDDKERESEMENGAVV